MPTIRSRTRRRSSLALVAPLLLVLATTACSDDEASSTTTEGPPSAAEGDLTIEAWVADFDLRCVETADALSDPSLTDEELASISAAAIADMRAIGEPTTRAEEAAVLLDTIEAQSTGTELTDEEIAEMDARFLEAARSLGVSDACIGGAPG